MRFRDNNILLINPLPEHSNQVDILLDLIKTLLNHIQDKYGDYKASLEFASSDELEDYLALDYPNLELSAQAQIASFIASDSETKEITFNRV